jgi:hypothetical protein
MAEFCPNIIPGYIPNGELRGKFMPATCKATYQTLGVAPDEYERCTNCPFIDYKITDQHCRLTVSRNEFDEFVKRMKG